MTVVVAILGLIFLIIIHELGHMLTAKALGVRVPEFGIGFGPPLFKKKIGRTTYSFRIILLGGFARMAGMGYGEHEAENEVNELLRKRNNLEERIAHLKQELEPLVARNQNLEGQIAQATNERNALQSQKNTLEVHITQAQQELAALQNRKNSLEAQIQQNQQQLDQSNQELIALLAQKQLPEAEIQRLQALPGNHAGHIRQVQEQLNQLNAQIGQQQQQVAQLTQDIGQLQQQVQQLDEQIAQKRQQIQRLQQDIAQLQDQLRQVKGQIAQNQQQLDQVSAHVAHRQQQLAQLKDQLKEVVPDTFPTKAPWRRALIILAGPLANILAAVAILAGMLMISGAVTEVRPEVREVEPGSMAAHVGIRVGDRLVAIDGERIKGWEGFTREVAERRPGEEISVTVERGGAQRTFTGELGADPASPDRAIVGVRPEVEKTRYGPLEALGMAIGQVVRVSGLLGAFVGDLITNEADLYDNVTGPVGIASVGATSVEQGFFPQLLALISVNLALFNLLPILPLDGGHLLFIAAEKVMGRPVSQETMGRIAALGIALVLMLFLFATYADLSKIFTGQPFIPE